MQEVELGKLADIADGDSDTLLWCSLGRKDNRSGWELQNLLTLAQLMIGSALTRQESRGVHFRSDFPTRDDAHWQRHIVCPWHGYEFDLATGCHPGDPAMRLTPVPVAVRNGHIYVSVG